MEKEKNNGVIREPSQHDAEVLVSCPEQVLHVLGLSGPVEGGREQQVCLTVLLRLLWTPHGNGTFHCCVCDEVTHTYDKRVMLSYETLVISKV